MLDQMFLIFLISFILRIVFLKFRAQVGLLLEVAPFHPIVASLISFLTGGILVSMMLALFTLSSAGMAEATTFYVVTTGSHSNPGTETQPLQTINKGVSVLESGDTLRIKGGTYKEWLDWGSSFPAGTPWNAPAKVKVNPQ